VGIRGHDWRRCVLWIPTRRDKVLLLQPHRPDALLERLRELARDKPPR
jgi:hypothetical protein